MTLTEAYEMVLQAALGVATYEASRGEAHTEHNKKLMKAIHKISPRVTKMRLRLNAIRARKAGKPTCPKWAIP